LAQDPFPLFPGERLVGSIQPLQIVEDNSALRLRAKRDFTDRYAKNPDTGALGIDRRAGDEWLFRGLATYYPQAEVEIMQTVHAIVLKPNNALRVRATDDCVDYLRKKRTAGEEWLVKKEGAYLVGVNEQVVSNLQASVLTEESAFVAPRSASLSDS
jgi:major vault protein